ncbi:hypothetical protein WP1_294 [Pseudomonas phage WP1]
MSILHTTYNPGGRFDFSFRSSRTARLSQERQRALTDVTMSVVDNANEFVIHRFSRLQTVQRIRLAVAISINIHGRQKACRHHLMSTLSPAF